MSGEPCIVWFRQDLRISDNPALYAAAASGRPVICLYVLDDITPGRWRMGGASRWWLHHSLKALSDALAKRKLALVLRRGEAGAVLSEIVAETGAGALFWNRCYEPQAIARDTTIKETLSARGLDVQTFNGALLFEPWSVKTKTGQPFKVFTPFWRACLGLDMRAPLPDPKRLQAFTPTPKGDDLADLNLLPVRPNWAKGFEANWTPGEAGAKAALAAFVDGPLADYPEQRDAIGAASTSRLSAHLHFGEISPVQVAAAAGDLPGAAKYMTEIGWREFSTNLLFHWPKMPEENWKQSFDAFPWRDDEVALEAWRRGRTGYPLIDAAMRELWATGFMPNRARMVTASFLIKHLLIDWRRGEDWFWDTLIDADLANNAASWQWVAGSGADAAPYFRIFNPIAQGERFDADGDYVRRWVPELSKLPNDLIHAPWRADEVSLAKAGVVLGATYPHPIVDHDTARARALSAFASISN